MNLLRFVSAAFVLLLLCGPVSAGTVKYVDVMFGDNLNDGGSWATPWASPSYGTDTTSWTTGTLASPDTMYIRGNTSDSFYLDRCNVYDLHLDIVGISDATFSDSPVFTPFPGQVAFVLRDVDGVDDQWVIDGIRFDSGGYGDNQFIVIQLLDDDSAWIRNCLFIGSDSVQTEDVGIIYVAAFAASAARTYVNFTNDVWYRHRDPFVMHYGENDNLKAEIAFVNCDIRDCTNAITATMSGAPAITSDTVYSFTDCVVNADTLYFLYDISTGGTIKQTIEMAYCDTFGQDIWGYSTATTGLYNVVRTGDTTDADPDFTDADGTDTAYWCYLNSTSPLITTGSGGGIIGVTWGFVSAPAGAATVTRRNFFFTRWARILGIGL